MPAKKRRSSRAPRAQARTQVEEWTEQARFVFRGTVLQRGAATLDEVPLTRSTLVVSVDEIVNAPDALRAFEGQQITVQLGEGQRVTTGERYVFYTNGWLYGASLAVVSIGVTPDSDTHLGQLRQAMEAVPARWIQDRAKRADMVVSGQVTEIRDARPSDAPISEHDPLWRQATVAVNEVHQSAGRLARKPRQVSIRFAGSMDVHWADAPKFNVGDAGLWMLGDKDDTHRQALRATAGVEKDEYLVIDPLDYIPAHLTEQALALVKSGQGGAR